EMDSICLTIITINRNNASGLEKTMNSVLSQTCHGFEYVVVDGASTDESMAVVRRLAPRFGDRLNWISESDKGIYNAMNKGIAMASGQYVQFLNSGDCLASDDVVARMYSALGANAYPSILYGNMLKDMPAGYVLRDKCFAGQEISLLGLYTGTLNHSPAYIRKELFKKYGFYDEKLKIVSDWKWYLQSIVFGEEKPVYVDIDVTLFDMNGISETNHDLSQTERKQVLSEMVPATVLTDYDRWASSIERMKRLKRHPWAYKLVWFLERCLFKLEKISLGKKRETAYLN
ncbi:MAG: glycosyltransferase, partial [Lachnospiraceae bacterium]|nr:glycosyltransferase [Lachnospiraceae bacterium]